MPKIQSYVIKTSTLSARDKWIGTDSSGSITKNFTPEGMATFINETDFVTIAGQSVFKWQQSAGDRQDGSISLVGFGGNGDNLADLTTMLISDKTIGDSRIIDYLTAIVGQNVIMVEVNEPNNFVIATLTGVTPNTTYSGFNDLTWDVTLANGVINGSGNYVLANFSGSNVDTLDSVTNRGSVTSNSITTGGLTSTGDLNVSEGSKTTLSDDVEIKDAFPVINSGFTGAPVDNAGFLINRGDGSTKGIRWEETLDRWEMQQEAGNWSPIGSAAFLYEQGLPAVTWNITHNLNKYPSCVVVDTGGTTVLGQIDFTNLNNLSITFIGAFSGTAYLN
jgi:hypothetical protein